MALHLDQRSRFAWCRSWLDPWGWDRRNPPKTRFGHGTIGTLPFPRNAAEFLAILHELGPNLLQDTALTPALEPIVDSALGPKLLGQLIPLTAGPHPEDD